MRSVCSAWQTFPGGRGESSTCSLSPVVVASAWILPCYEAPDRIHPEPFIQMKILIQDPGRLRMFSIPYSGWDHIFDCAELQTSICVRGIDQRFRVKQVHSGIEKVRIDVVVSHATDGIV